MENLHLAHLDIKDERKAQWVDDRLGDAIRKL